MPMGDEVWRQYLEPEFHKVLLQKLNPIYIVSSCKTRVTMKSYKIEL